MRGCGRARARGSSGGGGARGGRPGGAVAHVSPADAIRSIPSARTRARASGGMGERAAAEWRVLAVPRATEQCLPFEGSSGPETALPSRRAEGVAARSTGCHSIGAWDTAPRLQLAEITGRHRLWKSLSAAWNVNRASNAPRAAEPSTLLRAHVSTMFRDTWAAVCCPGCTCGPRGSTTVEASSTPSLSLRPICQDRLARACNRRAFHLAGGH